MTGAELAQAFQSYYNDHQFLVDDGDTRNARLALAQAAARFHPRQPATVVAVTGTSGKTSVATFVREIWTAMGFPAASLGTVGVVSPTGTIELEHTTPDAMRGARHA